jgi:hypothetical protein
VEGLLKLRGNAGGWFLEFGGFAVIAGFGTRYLCAKGGGGARSYGKIEDGAQEKPHQIIKAMSLI